MAISRIINTTKAYIDDNGIWVGSLDTSLETQTSKKAWENNYNLTLEARYVVFDLHVSAGSSKFN